MQKKKKRELFSLIVIKTRTDYTGKYFGSIL